MKKLIFPLVAVMLIGAATNAQTTPKPSSNKTAAVTKPKTNTKSSAKKETFTTPKTTTTTPAKSVAIHKKHHKKGKKATPKK